MATEDNSSNSQNSRSADRDWNPGPCAQETGCCLATSCWKAVLEGEPQVVVNRAKTYLTSFVGRVTVNCVISVVLGAIHQRVACSWTAC